MIADYRNTPLWLTMAPWIKQPSIGTRRRWAGRPCCISPTGSVSTSSPSPTSMGAPEPEQDELANGRVLSIFKYTATWTWWERHPVGDEFVHTIAGKVDFELDDGQDRQTLRLTAGQGGGPQGAWHRAVLHVPSTLMFVTPTPALTEHRTIT